LLCARFVAVIGYEKVLKLDIYGVRCLWFEFIGLVVHWKGNSMSLWGKLAGGAAGLMIGGPLGGVLGLVAGHFTLDQWLGEERPDEKEVAFTVGVIALGAKIAKADGVVVRDEVYAFREVFKVPEDDMKNVARLFDLAKQDVAGFEAYARQLAELMSDDKPTLQDVLDGLFHIAKADNVLHPHEIDYLEQVAKIFGFTDEEFVSIQARHVREVGANPYDVLGVPKGVSDEDLKARYHALVKENHPDILIGRGVPEEFLGIATERLKAINEAYDVIVKERQL